MQLTELKTWIQQHEAQITAQLQRLVELNTFTRNTAGVDAGMAIVDQMVADAGLSVEPVNTRHRLIRAGNGQAKPRVLLISHMDTVFPPEGDFLHYEDLGDGFVRGPGTGDIKGGLLVGFWAMQALRELLSDFDVLMAISADEEIGSPGLREWYQCNAAQADYAIGLEPGFPQGELTPEVPLGVVYQRRGYCALRFTVQGRTSHSGVPHLGLNAIEAFAQRVTRLHALNAPEQGMSVNVGMVNAGTAANTVPGSAEGVVSFRYERLTDGETLLESIKQIISGSYVSNEHLGIWDSAEYTVDVFLPPMEHSDANQRLIDVVIAEAQRLGQNVVPIARGGGSDANHTSAGGVPSICGMGVPTQAIHTPEETIYLPGLFDRVELLASTLYRLYRPD